MTGPTQGYNTVSFFNPGLIDMLAVKNMGVNVKETDEAIGFFGTGLKYAIATLLRNNQQVDIFRGLQRFHFFKRPTTIRGKDFDLIYMSSDGEEEPLGITTELGKNWELWMAMRELHSNALDEGGSSLNVKAEPSSDKTLIRITGSNFYDTYCEKLEETFLQTKPIYEDTRVAIHPGESKYVYYRGVRCYELDKLSKYTYNVKASTRLTEDRTFANFYGISYVYISATILSCTDKAIITDLLTVTDAYIEHDDNNTIQWNHFDKASDQFKEVLTDLYRFYHPRLNEKAMRWYMKKTGKEFDFKPYKPNASELAMYKEACALCEAINHPVPKDKIVFVQSLNDNSKIAVTLPSLNKIYITQLAFNRGVNYLASTLLEEAIHDAHLFLDESRQFQDYLLDLVIKLAMENNS